MPRYWQMVPPYRYDLLPFPQNIPILLSPIRADRSVQMAGSFIIESIKYQIVLYSPLKKRGFIPESGTELFVKNIPKDATIEDMLRFFGSVGDIFQIRLMMEPDGQRNRSFAYVTYMNSTLAQKASSILADKIFLGRNYLTIENSLNNRRIFMGGLPVYKTKDEVWQELNRHGVQNITDVIMYRSYTDRAENRGFVFVEFRTHEEAAHFRAKYGKTLKLWGQSVIIDWSVPIPEVDTSAIDNVKILYLRNLNVWESPIEFESHINKFIQRDRLEKVYKFKNYAFVHVATRNEAEVLKYQLEEYYKGTYVEVTWAKPPNRYTTQEYRQKRVTYRCNLSKSRSSTSSCCSSSYRGTSSPPTNSNSPVVTPNCQSSTSHLYYTHEEVQGIVANVLKSYSHRGNSSLRSPESTTVDNICKRLVPAEMGPLPVVQSGRLPPKGPSQLRSTTNIAQEEYINQYFENMNLINDNFE